MEVEKIEEGSFARLEGNIYIIIGSYERNRSYDLCVKLGDFETKEFQGEEYQSKMKISKDITDLIETNDVLMLRDKENQECCIVGVLKDYLKDWIEDIKKGKLELLKILTREQFVENAYKIKK